MTAGSWTASPRIFWPLRVTATSSGSRAISRTTKPTRCGGWGPIRRSPPGSSTRNSAGSGDERRYVGFGRDSVRHVLLGQAEARTEPFLNDDANLPQTMNVQVVDHDFGQSDQRRIVEVGRVAIATTE